MLKLHLFPQNFQNILGDIKHSEFPGSSKSEFQSVLFLLLKCESVLFEGSNTLNLKPAFEGSIEDVIPKCLNTIKIILDITWEKINTGQWKDVDISWRYIYSFSSLFKVLFMMLEKDPSIKELIKVCDMGLLMGAPIMNNILNKIASGLTSLERIHPSEEIETNPSKKLKTEAESSVQIQQPIDERRWLSCKEFQMLFVNKKLPVILLNAVRQWPAFTTRKWSVDYILNKARHRIVPVEIGSKYTDENWTQKLMTIEEFILNYVKKKQGDQNVGYLAQHNLFSQIPELMEDIKLPMYINALWGEDVDVDINAWFGPAGTVSPLHHDPKHNFLVQVMGEKYVRLYAKEESKYLYPREKTFLSNTSQGLLVPERFKILQRTDNITSTRKKIVDVENPDLELFPLFVKAQYTECILRPGNMLYIPPECWHFVRSLSIIQLVHAGSTIVQGVFSSL